MWAFPILYSFLLAIFVPFTNQSSRLKHCYNATVVQLGEYSPFFPVHQQNLLTFPTKSIPWLSLTFPDLPGQWKPVSVDQRSNCGRMPFWTQATTKSHRNISQVQWINHRGTTATARDWQYHKLKDNDEADQKPKATKIIDVSRTALYRIHIVPHHNDTVW